MYPRLTDCWMKGLSSPGIRTGPGPRPDTSANGTSWERGRAATSLRVADDPLGASVHFLDRPSGGPCSTIATGSDQNRLSDVAGALTKSLLSKRYVCAAPTRGPCAALG